MKEQERIATQIIESVDPQLFCRQCNIALAYGLSMTGYTMQVINGNTIYRSAVFMGTLTEEQEKDFRESIAQAKRKVQQ